MAIATCLKALSTWAASPFHMFSFRMASHDSPPISQACSPMGCHRECNARHIKFHVFASGATALLRTVSALGNHEPEDPKTAGFASACALAARTPLVLSNTTPLGPPAVIWKATRIQADVPCHC